MAAGAQSYGICLWLQRPNYAGWWFVSQLSLSSVLRPKLFTLKCEPFRGRPVNGENPLATALRELWEESYNLFDLRNVAVPEPEPLLVPEPELVPAPELVPEPLLVPEPELVPAPELVPEPELVLVPERPLLVPEPPFRNHCYHIRFSIQGVDPQQLIRDASTNFQILNGPHEDIYGIVLCHIDYDHERGPYRLADHMSRVRDDARNLQLIEGSPQLLLRRTVAQNGLVTYSPIGEEVGEQMEGIADPVLNGDEPIENIAAGLAAVHMGPRPLILTSVDPNLNLNLARTRLLERQYNEWWQVDGDILLYRMVDYIRKNREGLTFDFVINQARHDGYVAFSEALVRINRQRRGNRGR